jgi:two-component system OmpR family response regulator
MRGPRRTVCLNPPLSPETSGSTWSNLYRRGQRARRLHSSAAYCGNVQKQKWTLAKANLSLEAIPMARTPHILIVEDDREIRTMVSRFLQKNAFRVSIAESSRSMERTLASARIDLIVLDLMLPDENGLDICRRLRATSSIPVIILTANGDPVSRVVGLEMGADDYVPKPFDPHELLARIKAVLRRTATLAEPDENAQKPLRFSGWCLDPVGRELRNAENVRITLTSAELDLLIVFCQHARKTLSRDQLLDLSQGRGAGALNRSIDILVSRIRRKIEDNPREPAIIKTVRIGGYIFTSEVTS